MHNIFPTIYRELQWNCVDFYMNKTVNEKIASLTGDPNVQHWITIVWRHWIADHYVQKQVV